MKLDIKRSALFIALFCFSITEAVVSSQQLLFHLDTLSPASKVPFTLAQKPPAARFALSSYHPITLINRLGDLRKILPVFGYQHVGRYPPGLVELEQALTLLAVEYEKTKAGKFGVLATPAGMPAINIMVDSALRKKRETLKDGPRKAEPLEIIVIEPPYGCTKNLMENWQRRGLRVHSLSVDEVSKELPRLVNDKTAIIYVESVTNPNLRVPNIEEILRINRGRAAVLVDDTFTTPEMLKSMLIEATVGGQKYSVDMAMIGLTKGATGTGNIIAGAVVARKEWLPLLSEYRNCLPEEGEVERALAGLRYLEVRFKAQSRNAARLSRFLQESSPVDFVNYPTRADHPDFFYTHGRIFIGGLMLYYVYKKLTQAIDHINLLSLLRTLINAVSLGQVRTLMERPSAGTHLTVGASAQVKGGISPAGIRGSIGIENPNDLLREMEVMLKILSLYPDGIPQEDLGGFNQIFMHPSEVREEGSHITRYLLPKWPIPHATFARLISDLPAPDQMKITQKYSTSKRFREAVELLIQATEITDYDPVTLAIHHRLLWCLLSGNYDAVIASPDESTTSHKANDSHMQATFVSILEGKKKGRPPMGIYSLYSRLGKAAVATLELLTAMLEVGIEASLNYDFLATSFYSESMSHKVFLETQAEIVMMENMMRRLKKGDPALLEKLLGIAKAKDPVFYKDVTAQSILDHAAISLFPKFLEDVRVQDPVAYNELQNEVRQDIRQKGLEIVIITTEKSPLHQQVQHLQGFDDAVTFRVMTPQNPSLLESELEATLSDKTVLVYLDSLRLRQVDPVHIREIVKKRNSSSLFGITDSFSLGYAAGRDQRDFDFVTHVFYHQNSDYGAVVVTKNKMPLGQVWHNPYWSRKNRATAMSEDTAVTVLWYVLPYLRIFDERFDENRDAANEVLSKVASIKRLDQRHLEMTFASPATREAFMKACQSALILKTDQSDAGYFYLNEWTALLPSKNDPRSLILRVGIDEPADLRIELEAVVSKLKPQEIPAAPESAAAPVILLGPVAALATSL